MHLRLETEPLQELTNRINRSTREDAAEEPSKKAAASFPYIRKEERYVIAADR